jgi:glycosyltransferase involved in cell wall biosynthesis
MRNADVLCQPSLVEPLGQALMEALATGRPVVATRVGGPPEYVTEQCGALVDPLDVESIAAGMRSAAALPVPCTAAVEVARRHDLALQAARVEAVLQRAVEAGRRPPR